MNMNQGRIRKERFPFFVLIVIIMVLTASLVVMLLWNNILSPVLHVSLITYWQAVGIFILSRILFGGFSKGAGFRGNYRGNPQWRQKWMQMTEEERTKFREERSRRCKDQR